MIALDAEQAIATGHVVAAGSALLAGAAVLLVPKGTHNHRVIGTVYVLALVLVNLAALPLHRENTFGVFQVRPGDPGGGPDTCTEPAPRNAVDRMEPMIFDTASCSDRAFLEGVGGRRRTQSPLLGDV